ncbi:hypothetical protein B0T18DRAFT_392152 [Schizothecium vesticola]|uniref:Uncharacterized protein n=1 Tax=Schizothecium vesticola TaxID=314040 RepID=A0AA40EQ07_9PEZI|nr:hypothetical protein B0T18DRAFT_392152 [Schizothecium vesticola]
MLPNRRGGRPPRRPKPEPSLAPLLPWPGPGPHPSPARAITILDHQAVNAILHHQAVPSIGPPANTAAHRLRDTVSPPSQHRPGPYTQPLAGDPAGDLAGDPAGDPAGDLGDGVLPVVPVRDVEISIFTEMAIITAPIASFDKGYSTNFTDRGTVELYHLANGPCPGEWRHTPRGARFCSRVAVVPFLLPNLVPLEISHTPKQVRMYIIEEYVEPLFQFGKHFQDEMEVGVHGDNTIHPYMLSPPFPDPASHHNMRQAFQDHFYVRSQPVSRNPQNTARATSPTNPPYEHTLVAADPQHEDWDIHQEM